MVEWIQPLQIADAGGKPTGKWRVTRTTDDPPSRPVGLCEHEHDTPEAAMDCYKASVSGTDDTPSRTAFHRGVEAAAETLERHLREFESAPAAQSRSEQMLDASYARAIRHAVRLVRGMDTLAGPAGKGEVER